jgi:hypothetical protein
MVPASTPVPLPNRQLLDVGYLFVHKDDLHVLVDVNLLRSKIDHFVWPSQYRLDLCGTLSQLHALGVRCLDFSLDFCPTGAPSSFTRTQPSPCQGLQSHPLEVPVLRGLRRVSRALSHNSFQVNSVLDFRNRYSCFGGNNGINDLSLLNLRILTRSPEPNAATANA